MYIKQIIIDGFKSYKDRVVVDPFSKNHNVVVGKNGSGKSNFFYAIQFVLSTEFSNLREEQRISLMYESPDPNLQNASVDIIFDNSDRRLPLECEEVILRRVIGIRKDQYYINKKLSTRNDCMNLLESAGLSKSNPYYIVKQGKINSLALSTDYARLQLLKEIAGTKVYDERKRESEKIFQQTENDASKIQEILSEIDEKIRNLNTDISELGEYESASNLHKSLEFAVYNIELKSAQDEIALITEKSKDSTERVNFLNNEIATIKEELKNSKHELKISTNHLPLKMDEREELLKHVKNLIKKQTDLQNKKSDIITESKKREINVTSYTGELEKLRENKTKYHDRLKLLLPEYEKTLKEYTDLESNLKNAEVKRENFYSKQGRCSQFDTRQKRDAWIDDNVTKMSAEIDQKSNYINDVEEEIHQYDKSCKKLEKELKKEQSCLGEKLSLYKSSEASSAESKQTKDVCVNKRSKLWREQNLAKELLNTLSQNFKHLQNSLSKTVGRSVLNGIESVVTVLNAQGCPELDYPGYKSTIIDAFTCAPEYNICVEVIAKKSLFNHIVDTDETSAKILENLNKASLEGESNFLPLNKLVVKRKSCQFTNIPNATPIINVLEFDEELRLAFELVFGSTLICKDLNVAGTVSKKYNVNCVTLDGDVVRASGSLSGGFIDNKSSQLDIYKDMRDTKREVIECENNLENIKTLIDKVESETLQAINQIQSHENETYKTKSIYESSKNKISTLLDQFDLEKSKLTPKEQSLVKYQRDLNFLKEEIEKLENEKKSNLFQNLTRDELQELKLVKTFIDENANKLKILHSQLLVIKTQKAKLESRLNITIKKRIEELVAIMPEQNTCFLSENLQKTEKNLKFVGENLLESEQYVSQLSDTIDNLQEKSVQLDGLINASEIKLEKLEFQFSDLFKFTSTFYSEKETLEKKCNHFKSNLDTLNISPDQILEKYKNVPLRQLVKKLEKSNEILAKYSHINKSAVEQHLKFNHEKTKFLERMKTLTKSKESIQQLIFHLEQKKYEAITLTFKQVAKYFSDIFEELVPGGKALLVMRKGDNEEETATVSNIIDCFTGIRIKVSFIESGEEMRDLHQLSGGQKSLVALTLIFAIQKCDPAPFYLFDEIDQALDPQHRKAVADSIHNLSDNAQFITTTFRPELLEHANKFYGVSNADKISYIDCIQKEEAYDFVVYENNQKINESDDK